MPPKRKAASSVRGPAKAGRDSAASTPGPGTPRSIDTSDDDFDDFSGQEASEEEAQDIGQAMSKFSVSAYKKKATKAAPSANQDSASHHFGAKDFSWMSLKPDHHLRPLWINPDKAHIVLESFNPYADKAQDFLTTISEPLSRPEYLHEYALTSNSLYAAVSVGLDPNDIISTLDRFSKTPIPQFIRDYITTSTAAFGKVKLVLKDTKYFLETADAALLQQLLKDEVIGPWRVQGSETKTTAVKSSAIIIPGTNNAAGVREAQAVEAPAARQNDGEPKQDDIYATLNEDDDDDDDAGEVHSFQIPDEGVEIVQRRCMHIGLPALEEYDFRNDHVNANLEIDLRPAARIRPYQEKSLSKMFGNGRAKSGIIVLPCGAGKTLVGITAACTIRKGVIILCTSSMSVVQWRQEFLKWSNINPNDIAVFTSDHKEKFTRNTGIIVTTYSMVTQTRQRSYEAGKMMEFLNNREWGLMILDEVHVVPAAIFRKVTSNIKTHSKLGLTATLLREDEKIVDLNFLIGPKLYEANWMELAEQGHIAKVQCAEVWCPMTTEFYSEYLRQSHRKRGLLYIMNPNKFQACQFLINYHEGRGDKIIVFSDNVYALKCYAEKLGRAYIYGETPQAERMRILDNFQHNENINTLFLSKIGDTSLDLPEATCLIQISSHYGSRRQEAQRLGRILRAKRRNDEGFNAFFYSLVSKDTQEMYYSSKRQAFLVDQGYAFKVITHLSGMEKLPGLAFATPAERRELLQNVMIQNEGAFDTEQINDDLFSSQGGKAAAARQKRANARRTAGMLSELSGGQDMAYVEMNRSKNKELKKDKKPANPFFKKLQRDQHKRALGI